MPVLEDEKWAPDIGDEWKFVKHQWPSSDEDEDDDDDDDAVVADRDDSDLVSDAGSDA